MEEETNFLVDGEGEAPTPNVEVPQSQPEKKKKKSKKGLIIVLSIIFVIFFLIPGLAFFLVYDGSTMKIKYDENFSAEKWGEALATDSLDYTVSEEAIKFSVSEKDINNMLYSSYKDSEELRKYLTQIAVDIKSSSYVFSVSGKFGFFKTRITLTAKLEKKKMDNHGSEEDAYVFTIKGASLGKLGFLKGAVISILKNSFSSSDSIDVGSNIKIHTDFDHSRLYIFASDLRELITSSLSGDSGGTSDFYTSFINDFLDNNLVEIDFYSNESFSVKVKLNELKGNDYGEGQYVCYNMPYENTTTKLTIKGEQKKLSLDVIRDALVSLLDDHLIQENEMNAVSEYLFNGYHDDNAPSCSLQSIGINDKLTYRGFNVATDISIDDLITNSVSSFDGYSALLNSFDLANLKESDINAFLHTQNLFGNKFFLTREVDEGGYKSSYIAFDNAYLNLTSEGAIVTAGININGLETIITILMDLDEANSTGPKLAFDTREIYFGDTDENGDRISATGGTKNLLFTTLTQAANTDSFSFSPEGKLTMDFSALITQGINQIVTDPEYKAFMEHNAKYSVRVVGDNVTDNSVVRLTAKRI